jgi:SEC-C motif-containing protein
MRSRYSAYALHLVDYVVDTWHPDSRPPRSEIAQSRTRWLGLEVVESSAGGPDDPTGTVTFVAIYRDGPRRRRLREKSRFVREKGVWFYVDGELEPE